MSLYNIDNPRLYSPDYTQNQILIRRREWLKEALKTPKCDKCPRTDTLTIDHIIPQDILSDMGFDFSQFYDEENLRLLCRPCNQLKGRHLDFSTPKTKQLLSKYLSNL